ncbi:Eisosome component PIL1-domain-containing protein [Sphaerosporella brunnea]|uniref:Eisosome component PIL1-domain-containing protein n=1 Tax=Sphaerosporella brunnea TaxID=1250544 RepID=A0A5J5F0Y8_9PEZI|nr:Eisosome component PIL1-domain-containing protein [Sphaerosporella brunnea]
MPLLPPPYTPHKASSTTTGTKASSRNRSLSVRGRPRDPSAPAPPVRKHRFTLASLRGNYQPELSRRLYRLIKTENHVITSYESAGRERQSIANQLSEWGEQTGDDAVNELSDKLGVLLSELGAQEEAFAQSLEEYRSVLKQIRNTESSVQPSREHKAKITDEIAKLRYKDPSSTKITLLEQELVRAEAENLVAEAQLTNVTRSKLKEAFAAQFVAVIERAEKQTVLARHGLRMLNLLDDTPVVPGEQLLPFEHEREARQILLDAEEELKDWSLNIEEEVTTNAHVVAGGVIDGQAAASASSAGVVHQASAVPPPNLVHPVHRHASSSSGSSGGSSGYGSAGDAPYPLSDHERAKAAGKQKAVLRRQQSMLAVA